MAENEVIKQIGKEMWVLAYFSYPGCNVCKVLQPKIKSVVEEFPVLRFVYVNTEQEKVFSAQNMVFAVPTILLFHSGREMRRWSRLISVQQVREELNRLIVSE